jgi:hypothetical protein
MRPFKQAYRVIQFDILYLDPAAPNLGIDLVVVKLPRLDKMTEKVFENKR